MKIDRQCGGMKHNSQNCKPEPADLAPTVNLLDARDVYAAVVMHFDHLDVSSSFIIFGCGASPHGTPGVMLSRMRMDECTEPRVLAHEVARIASNLQELGATHLALLAIGNPQPGVCLDCSGERAECFDPDRRDVAVIDDLVHLCDLASEACLAQGVVIPCALHAYEGAWAFSSTADSDYWRVSHLGVLEESAFAASAVASGIPFCPKVEGAAVKDSLLTAARTLCDDDDVFHAIACPETVSRAALMELTAQHEGSDRSSCSTGENEIDRCREALLSLASLAAIGPGRDHIIASVIGLEEAEPLSPSVAIECVFEDADFLPGSHLMPGGEGDRAIAVLAGVWRHANAWECSTRYRAAFANLGAIAAFLLWFSGRMGEAHRLASDIIAVEDSCEMAELVVGLGEGGLSPLWLEKAYAPVYS